MIQTSLEPYFVFRFTMREYSERDHLFLRQYIKEIKIEVGFACAHKWPREYLSADNLRMSGRNTQPWLTRMVAEQSSATAST